MDTADEDSLTCILHWLSAYDVIFNKSLVNNLWYKCCRRSIISRGPFSLFIRPKQYLVNSPEDAGEYALSQRELWDPIQVRDFSGNLCFNVRVSEPSFHTSLVVACSPSLRIIAGGDFLSLELLLSQLPSVKSLTLVFDALVDLAAVDAALQRHFAGITALELRPAYANYTWRRANAADLDSWWPRLAALASLSIPAPLFRRMGTAAPLPPTLRRLTVTEDCHDYVNGEEAAIDGGDLAALQPLLTSLSLTCARLENVQSFGTFTNLHTLSVFIVRQQRTSHGDALIMQCNASGTLRPLLSSVKVVSLGYVVNRVGADQIGLLLQMFGMTPNAESITLRLQRDQTEEATLQSSPFICAALDKFNHFFCLHAFTRLVHLAVHVNDTCDAALWNRFRPMLTNADRYQPSLRTVECDKFLGAALRANSPILCELCAVLAGFQNIRRVKLTATIVPLASVGCALINALETGSVEEVLVYCGLFSVEPGPWCEDYDPEPEDPGFEGSNPIGRRGIKHMRTIDHAYCILGDKLLQYDDMLKRQKITLRFVKLY